MIIYRYNDLKMVETRSDMPNSDWTGEAEFVIDETNPDNMELIEKINRFAPYFEYVTDEHGNLIDVVGNDVVRPDPEPAPESEAVTWDELDAAYQKGVDSI